MSQHLPEVHKVSIKPVECLKEGYALIKNQYWLFLGITVVGLIIGGAVPVVIIGPMMCGIYLCLLQQMRGEEVKFETLFKGFDFFMPSLIASLIQFVPIIILIFGSYILFFAVFFALAASQGGSGDGNPAAALGMIVMIFLFVIFILIMGVLIQALFIFMYPLIVDKNLSGVDAVKTSFSAVRANLGGVFGLVLLNLGVTLIGVLCCYVGVFFVVPVTMASQAVLYRKVFPPDFSQTAVAPQWQS
ncbi:MAG TPA: DUF975 family protein [Pyrinomonadaceae bacterium]|jgi:uncharacterized membrane protein